MFDKKYRPNKFEDIVGNEEIVEVLKNHVSNKEHPHVYLFSGPSGCGKTTLARILAKNMGITENVNYVEINAASARGIDTIREIQGEVNTAPFIDSCKFYVFDESHKLTGDAQPALLKLTEDVPEHVYFVFCTTEPNSMIKPLLGRCSHYKVKPLDDVQMHTLISSIALKESGVLIEEKIMIALINKAEGSSRSALKMFEDIIGCNDGLALEIIASYSTEEIDEQVLILCRKLVNGTWPELLEVYKNTDISQPESIRRICLGYLHSCLVSTRKQQDVIKLAVLINELKQPVIDSGKAGLLGAFAQAKIKIAKEENKYGKKN